MNADTAGRKAAAERSALLSLAAILTHDLSNPLQSVTVLCELGLEDDDPAEAPRRAEQTLLAAERMRDLLHAYASLVRTADRPTKVGEAVKRTTAMFLRRCERHRITLHTALERDFDGPSATGLAVVALFLAMIHAAEDASGPFEARIRVDASVVTASMLDSDGNPVSWPQSTVAAVDDVLGDEGTANFTEATMVVRLESPAP